MGAPNKAMMPSPVYWFTVPSKACTASVRRPKKASSSWCQSSSPSVVDSSTESTMSTKSTVTGLRSPAMALAFSRMRRCKCRGV